MLGLHPFSLFPKPRFGMSGTAVLPSAGFRRAKQEITTWPGYAPTPLHELPDLGRGARLAMVRLKEEQSRFGLASFNALGGAYAVGTVLLDLLSPVRPMAIMPAPSPRVHDGSIAAASMNQLCFSA